MIIEELGDRWWRRVTASGLSEEIVRVSVRALKPKEAIGSPSRSGYALLKGHEVMIQAELRGAHGQAFTDEPTEYEGSLEAVHGLPLTSSKERALLVASANATYSHLGLISGTRHCRDSGPEDCGKAIAAELAGRFPPGARMVMLGYQPAIAHFMSKAFSSFRVTDMDPGNIGKVVEGMRIEPHTDNEEAIKWSDVVLSTGSTLVNGTMEDIIRAGNGKKVIFFGVTVAAAAYEFGFDRLCFEALE